MQQLVGRMEQRLWGQARVSVHAAGLRPHALCQCRHDHPVRGQLAAPAVPTGHGHQQRSQHGSNGPAGAPAVCRAHHSALGAGHPAGHCWAAADQRLSHQHSRHTSSSAAAAGAKGGLQQQARYGSCQEAFVRASQQQRHAAPARAHSSASAAPCLGGSALIAGRGGSSRSLHQAAAAAAHSATTTALAQPQPLRAETSSAGPGSSNAADLGDGHTACDSSSSDSSSDSPTDSVGAEHSSSSALSFRRGRGAQLGRLSYRMLVSYDGTAYSGWQLQSRARTIQAEIERALTTVLREDRDTLCVCAAGRTDAGVHAVGQVVQFMTNASSIDPQRLPYKLNSLLPHDIRISWMAQTAPDFNVTVTAKHKTYHYNLDTGACHDPLRLRYSHHVRYPVDLGAMQAAASLLVGTHDFTQLSNDSVERLRRNPVKTLQRFDVVQVGPAHVRLEVQGTGFLYKQVRHMTGVLLAVGQGKLALEHLQHLLQIGNSQPPGAGGIWRGYNVAPAKGLQLFQIEYPAAVDDPSTLLYPDLEHDEFGRLLSRIPGASSIDEE